MILTGSHAYGTPHEASDIDLVLLLDNPYDDCDIYRLLRAYNEKFNGENDYPGTIRYGMLNLILCENPETFDIWVRATNLLKEFAPVTREQAVYVIKGLRLETLTIEQARQYLS